MENLGVIFDMDGVIIDSEPVYQALNRKIFKQLGIEVDKQFQLEYVGVTKWRKWQLLKDQYQLHQSIDELIALQEEVFSQEYWDYKSLLFPEVTPLLLKLVTLNIPIALATSSVRKKVDQVLKQCGLQDYFSVIVTGDEVVRGKPDPEIFLTAAKKLKLPPEKCIVIEDSYNGILAAKKAKMYGIGVKHPAINVNLSIADKVIHSLKEIEIVR